MRCWLLSGPLGALGGEGRGGEGREAGGAAFSDEAMRPWGPEVLPLELGFHVCVRQPLPFPPVSLPLLKLLL